MVLILILGARKWFVWKVRFRMNETWRLFSKRGDTRPWYHDRIVLIGMPIKVERSGASQDVQQKTIVLISWPMKCWPRELFLHFSDDYGRRPVVFFTWPIGAVQSGVWICIKEDFERRRSRSKVGSVAGRLMLLPPASPPPFLNLTIQPEFSLKLPRTDLRLISHIHYRQSPYYF